MIIHGAAKTTMEELPARIQDLIVESRPTSFYAVLWDTVWNKGSYPEGSGAEVVSVSPIEDATLSGTPYTLLYISYPLDPSRPPGHKTMVRQAYLRDLHDEIELKRESAGNANRGMLILGQTGQGVSAAFDKRPYGDQGISGTSVFLSYLLYQYLLAGISTVLQTDPNSTHVFSEYGVHAVVIPESDSLHLMTECYTALGLGDTAHRSIPVLVDSNINLEQPAEEFVSAPSRLPYFPIWSPHGAESRNFLTMFGSQRVMDNWTWDETYAAGSVSP